MKPHPHWLTRARLAHERLSEDDAEDHMREHRLKEPPERGNDGRFR